MIPHDFTETFVHDRQAELRAAATVGRTTRAEDRPTLRRRLGRFLIQTGLHLAGDRGEQLQVSLPA
ncbi:hypothetical protein VSH64_47045 [Amycolatopsis rhabdoformis]|uniref:Uncharacterized protein n=1 Tax=Amycolatopsis rhabdoformis TaxID=1448059 RepID=A0ABZ1I7C1_9PSEU|nr:hypothetical protein [Amycolatopsis rhabdoformis]WSE30270.1 hypothetical protein VSH64_47045 [Amycolatopsis rhabdoformis]